MSEGAQYGEGARVFFRCTFGLLNIFDSLGYQPPVRRQMIETCFCLIQRRFWSICLLILSGFILVQQAAVLDCLSFDPFSLQLDGLIASYVNIGGRKIAQALMVAMVIIGIDELVDAGFEMAR
jgi:hypothetical protein